MKRLAAVQKEEDVPIPAIELKPISDLIDALGKVVTGTKGLAGFAPDERKKYRDTMTETYRVIDTTLVMLITRLTDVLRKNSAEFLDEVALLESNADWLRVERDFRLCGSLRTALSETKTTGGRLKGKLIDKLVIGDWDALLRLMDSILNDEEEVADRVAQGFRALACAASNAKSQGTGEAAVKKETEAFREALIAERERLIKQEIDLYNIV